MAHPSVHLYNCALMICSWLIVFEVIKACFDGFSLPEKLTLSIEKWPEGADTKSVKNKNGLPYFV